MGTELFSGDRSARRRAASARSEGQVNLRESRLVLFQVPIRAGE